MGGGKLVSNKKRLISNNKQYNKQDRNTMTTNYNNMGMFAGGQNSYNAARESSGGYEPRFPIFPNGEPVVVLSLTNKISGRILPAFDTSYHPQDPSRATSVMPYRLKGDIDADTGFEKFSPWFVSLLGYTFYGSGKNTFLSPLCWKGIENGKACDPIFELRMHIYRDKKINGPVWQKYQHLVLPVSDFKSQIRVLPGYSTLTFLNVVCTPSNPKEEDTSARPRVLMLKDGATKHMFDSLNKYCPPIITPIDPDYPQFQFGDVTHPERGLYFSVTEETISAAAKGACLEFGKMDNAKGVLSVSTYPVTNEMLAARTELCDYNNYYIPTTQDIVDLLAEERLVPYDLLSEVMGDRAHMPKAYTSKEAIYEAKPVEKKEAAPYAPTLPGAAPMTPTAPSIPAMPAVPEREFWIIQDNAPKLVKEAAIKEMGYTGQVCAVNTNEWKNASEFGLAATPVAPSIPSVPAMPSATSTHTPAVNTSPMPVSDIQSQPTRRTAEQEAEIKSIESRLNSNEVTPTDFIRYKELSALAPYAG